LKITHKFPSKKKLVVLTLLTIATVMSLTYSQSTAQTPHIYHEEIEIIQGKINPKLFTFIGSACVDSKGEIINPKVMLYSDLEQKPLTLINVFNSDECFGAVQKILANDPESIEAKIISYGDNSVIKEMEKNIEELKDLQTQQQRAMMELNPRDFDLHNQYINEMREISDSLFNTQKLLQQETAKYYETQRYLHPTVEP